MPGSQVSIQIIAAPASHAHCMVSPAHSAVATRLQTFGAPSMTPRFSQPFQSLAVRTSVACRVAWQLVTSELFDLAAW